ncbi:MAG: polymer-forming cytoskeletal protein [Spirochaetota bacterium]|nr:polymer-forming cytoskeletal protein [Spirochaetota bacterium]
MAGRNDSINSTISEGSVFEGKFNICGSLKIDGKFEGEIKTEEELIIGETGKVKTNIEARTVVVSGTVIGNIKAREEVKLLGTSKVRGDITTPFLSIERGVIIQGNVVITGDHNGDIDKFIEDSFEANKHKPKGVIKKEID